MTRAGEKLYGDWEKRLADRYTATQRRDDLKTVLLGIACVVAVGVLWFS